MISYIQSPCKDCSGRHLKCHATCEKYADYKARHRAESDRLYEENKIDKIIKELNYKGSKKTEKTSLPLRHGRKRER